jgi:16S rRNA (guanine527-N7)-methyltransferase
MFHGKHSGDALERAAARVGAELAPAQRTQLNDFAEWLATEATDAGGIGPEETSRLVDRHLADSIVFAAAWKQEPEDVLDVGSGVGLPGIPLAVLYPDSDFTLLDRSGRRCHLARRASRILGLDNVRVEQRDISGLAGSWDSVTFRASLQPAAALAAAVPLLKRRGSAVIGLSRTREPDAIPDAPTGTAVDVVEIDETVLDSPAWLLRMMLTNPRDLDRDSS